MKTKIYRKIKLDNFVPNQYANNTDHFFTKQLKILKKTDMTEPYSSDQEKKKKYLV